MKKIQTVAVFILLTFLAVLPAIGYTNGATAFTVGRLVVAGGIENHEPVNVSEKLPASAGTAYCFLEAKSVAQDTDAVFIWYRGDDTVARVSVPLGQGNRWRTYSSINTGGIPGDWRVELQDNEGNVMGTVGFKVE